MALGILKQDPLFYLLEGDYIGLWCSRFGKFVS